MSELLAPLGEAELRYVADGRHDITLALTARMATELLAARKRIAELEEMARAVAAFDKAGEAALREDRS